MTTVIKTTNATKEFCTGERRVRSLRGVRPKCPSSGLAKPENAMHYYTSGKVTIRQPNERDNVRPWLG